MGPNGSGKSTLSYVLSGRDDFTVTEGRVTFDGLDLLDMAPEKRAQAGLFLAFQAPVELPGVGNANFLRTALNAQFAAPAAKPELDAAAFLKLARAEAKRLAHARRRAQAQRQCRLFRRRERSATKCSR